MPSIIVTLLILAVAIVVALGAYAYKLTQRVKAREQEVAEQLAEIDRKAEEVMDEVAHGITVIARACLQKELSSTEAALRVVGILEQLQLASMYKNVYPSVFDLAERTKHIPILEEWHKLSKQAQFNFDQERIRAEEELEASIQSAFKALTNFKRPKFDNAAA